jgi:ketosteroid isomerase-like protein
MDLDEARRFADEWVAGWNSHELDRIMKHYADDVVFRSPVAARIIEGSDGTVLGIDALRAYWAEGLRRIPDLHFELIEVYAGIDTVVLNYRNQTGQLVNEVLTFQAGLIVSGIGTYGPLPGTRS